MTFTATQQKSEFEPKQPTLSTVLTKPNFFSTLSRTKPPEHTYLDTRVTKSQRKNKRTRSQRARERLRTKEHLARLAVGLGEVELVDKLQRCHSRLSVLTCGRHIARIIPNFTCEFRLCPDCGRRRSRRLQHKYLPMMGAFMLHNKVTPVHLVLTQTHREESRKQSAKRIKDSFTKLQRREFWKRYFKGGTWSLEFTKDKNGLHHTHFAHYRTPLEVFRHRASARRMVSGYGRQLRFELKTDS